MIDFDQSHTKAVEIGGYNVKCFDPYGFWKIFPKEAGSVPKELEGHFTSLAEAEKTINALALKKQNAPSKIKKVGQGHVTE